MKLILLTMQPAIIECALVWVWRAAHQHREGQALHATRFGLSTAMLPAQSDHRNGARAGEAGGHGGLEFGAARQMNAYGDPHCVGRTVVDCDRPYPYASRHELAGFAGAGYAYDEDRLIDGCARARRGL